MRITLLFALAITLASCAEVVQVPARYEFNLAEPVEVYSAEMEATPNDQGLIEIENGQVGPESLIDVVCDKDLEVVQVTDGKFWIRTSAPGEVLFTYRVYRRQ